MKKEENYITPDYGRVLYVKPFKRITTGISLGESYALVDGIQLKYTLVLDDIEEGYLVDDKFIKGTTYNEVVASLIALKYSYADELALQANARINKDTKEEKDFQEYRKQCKEIAKKLLNE